MKKIILSFFALLIVGQTAVFAQYDSEVINPTYRDNSEVFGIDTQANKKITFYPDGCKSIERVVIEFKTAVKGEIKVISYGEKSPKDKSIEKPYEYCEMQFLNIKESDINSFMIETKVRKTWLASENVDQDNIGVYSYKDEDWKINTTTKEKDNSIYNYYTSNVAFSTFFAIGEYKQSLPFGISPWLLVVCCVLLIFLILLLSLLYSSRRRKDQYSS